MSIELGRPDVMDRHEGQAVATSIQSWRRFVALAGRDRAGVDRLVPYFNGEPVRRQPPGLTWMHMAAFSVSAGPERTADTLVLHARCVSVAIAMMTLAGVYWAGLSLGGAVTGLLATLVCAANPSFLYSARLASGSIHHTGWVLLSTAAALWAIRPLRPVFSLWRQAIGWGICGMALGVAMLTAGPSVVAEVCGPILLVLVLCPNRINHSMGLLAAVLIGALMILPWAGYVQGEEPGIWQVWLGELVPDRWAGWGAVTGVLGRQMVWVGLILLPWTLWLLGAVVWPLRLSPTGTRSRVFLGWVWFMSVIGIRLLLYPSGQWNDALVILPPFAVLTGQLFNQYSELAAQGRFVWFWRWMRWPQLILLAAASVAVPLFLYVQPVLVERGRLAGPWTGGVHWPVALGMAVVLLLVIGLSTRWVVKQHPQRVLVSWAGWVLAMAWMVMIPVVRGPAAVNPVRDEARRFAQLAQGHRVYWVHDGSRGLPPLDPRFVLYLDQPVRPISGRLIDPDDRGGAYFLVNTDAAGAGPGFEPVAHLSQTGMDVWRAVAAGDAVDRPAVSQPESDSIQ